MRVYLKSGLEEGLLGRKQCFLLQFLHSSRIVLSGCCAEQDLPSSHYPSSDLVCILSASHYITARNR